MPELKFKIAFELGEDAYLKNDIDQYKGTVISIKKNWNGGVYYEVKFCDDSDWYQAIELSRIKDIGMIRKATEDEGNDDDPE